MRQIRIRQLLAVLILAVSAAGQGTTGAAPQDSLYENPGKLVQGGSDVALTGRFLPDGERVSGERFGSVIVAARASKLSQVAERGSHVRMIWAYAVLVDGQGPAQIRFTRRQFGSSNGSVR